MDIWNNKTILQARMRRFTLKATASAVFTLNAGSVMSQSCPSEIYGNTLAGLICDFDGGNSVTVKNDGTVGGIRMINYQPTDSSITIDARGQVSNISSTGIALSSSSLSKGLSNNGTISAPTGISITANSIINGGIINRGLISTENAGILINSSVILTGLSNKGEIKSTAGVGLSITSTTISGDISNSSLIDTRTTSITINSSSTINGNISNSGTINSANATGIRMTNSIVNGNLFNSGTINGGGVDSGITIISSSSVTGNITNKGSINAFQGNAIALSHSEIDEGISNDGRVESNQGNGISVTNQTSIQKKISNNGLISGGQNGISILSQSSVGGIVNNGTIRGGINGLNITTGNIANGITNTGSIIGDTTGINIFVGSGTLEGRISNSGTIQGNVAAIHIEGGINNYLDILGQKARVIGAVEAVETNVTITNGARFSSEGSYNVKTFNIAQNALFNMANSVTVADASGFSNAGTLAINNSSQTIIGDYKQQLGGVFRTAVTSAADYGQLSVTSVVDLSQSGNIDVQVAQNASLHAGDVLANVINGNTLIQPTDGFNVTDNSFIWRFSSAINNTNTGVNLTPAIDPAAYTVCQGLYCQGAANAIIGQVAAGNSLFTPYGALSTASALQTAASQATPELTNENIQIIQLITRSVVDVAPMWSTLRGRSSGDAMFYQPGKIWVKPYGGSMNQGERNTVNGFNATTYGGVVGKDIELSNNWLFGGALAAGGDNMQGKSVLSGQSIHSNAYQGMLYGSKQFPKQFYVAGQSLVGYENNHTSRAIPLYTSTAKGSYASWFTNIRAEAGWSTHAFSPKLVFTPEIDASYLFINQGSYQESGSPMDLSVAANNHSSLVLGAYGNAVYHLTTLKTQHALTLSAYAGIAGDVINSQPQVTATFLAAGSSFSTFGVQFNGAVFRGGVGLNLTSQTKPLSVEFNYDLQAGNNAYSEVGAATIKYKL